MNAIKLPTGIIYGIMLIFALILTSTADESAQVGWAVEAVNSASNTVGRLKNSKNTATRVKSLVDLAKAYMNATQYNEAENIYKKASEINKTAFKNIKGNFKHTLTQQVVIFAGLADAQIKQGKFETAQQNYERGLHTAKLGIPASSPEVKHLRTGHIVCVARRSTKTAAESLFSQLLSASERASGFVSADLAMILENQIEYRAYSRRLSECEAMSKRLVDVSKRVYGSDHPEIARALARQASVIYVLYEKSGDLKELQKALPLMTDALRIRMSAFGPNHEITITTKKSVEDLIEKIRKNTPNTQ